MLEFRILTSPISRAQGVLQIANKNFGVYREIIPLEAPNVLIGVNEKRHCTFIIDRKWTPFAIYCRGNIVERHWYI